MNYQLPQCRSTPTATACFHPGDPRMTLHPNPHHLLPSPSPGWDGTASCPQDPVYPQASPVYLLVPTSKAQHLLPAPGASSCSLLPAFRCARDCLLSCSVTSHMEKVGLGSVHAATSKVQVTPDSVLCLRHTLATSAPSSQSAGSGRAAPGSFWELVRNAQYQDSRSLLCRGPALSAALSPQAAWRPLVSQLPLRNVRCSDTGHRRNQGRWDLRFHISWH